MTRNRLTLIPLARVAGFGACLAVFMAGCTPTVKIQAPDKPIVINLNVKIEQEVRVKVEQDAKTTVSKRPDLF